MKTESSTDVKETLAELRDIIDQREELARQDKVLSERRQLLEHSLLAFHEESGLESLSSSGLSVSFDAKAMRVKYEPDKWTSILRWALDNGHDYIVQRRITDAKVLSLVADGVALPAGLSLDNYVKLNIRRK